MKKMTKTQKRIAIAQDVIDRLDAKKYKATPGKYINIVLRKKIDESITDLQQVVDLPMRKCEVCALGGFLLSKARLLDDVPLANFPGGLSITVDSCSVSEGLGEIFHEDDLGLMESSFELRDMTPYYLDTEYSKVDLAIAFGKRHKKPADRMRAIATNIIDNNGRFKPWKSI